MSSGLRSFLQKCRKNIKSTNKIVIGNEALDMDTAAMTLSYAYILSETKNTLHLPVFNLKSDLYHLKTEVEFVLKLCGIEKADLIFLNDLDSDFTGNYETTLVDCNIYKGGLTNLEIVRVQDHHKVEIDVSFLKFSDESEIDLVGSGSSLVTEHFKKVDIQEKSCLKMLASAIILDTTNFSNTVGRLHQRDIDAFEFIKSKTDQISTFEALSEAKFSVKGFSREDCLLKDAKYIVRNTVIIAALACSSEKFVNLESESHFKNSMDSFMKKFKLTKIFAISKIMKDEHGENVRELLVYPRASAEFCTFFLGDEVVKPKMKNGDNSDETEFTVFQWWNMKPTRKYILPKLEEFYESGKVV